TVPMRQRGTQSLGRLSARSGRQPARPASQGPQSPPGSRPAIAGPPSSHAQKRAIFPLFPATKKLFAAPVTPQKTTVLAIAVRGSPNNKFANARRAAMRSPLLSSLVLAVLLLASPAFAATPSAPKTSETTAPKSAALTNHTAFKVDPYKALRSKF